MVRVTTGRPISTGGGIRVSVRQDHPNRSPDHSPYLPPLPAACLEMLLFDDLGCAFSMSSAGGAYGAEAGGVSWSRGWLLGASPQRAATASGGGQATNQPHAKWLPGCLPVLRLLLANVQLLSVLISAQVRKQNSGAKFKLQRYVYIKERRRFEELWVQQQPAAGWLASSSAVLSSFALACARLCAAPAKRLIKAGALQAMRLRLPPAAEACRR